MYSLNGGGFCVLLILFIMVRVVIIILDSILLWEIECWMLFCYDIGFDVKIVDYIIKFFFEDVFKLNVRVYLVMLNV